MCSVLHKHDNDDTCSEDMRKYVRGQIDPLMWKRYVSQRLKKCKLYEGEKIIIDGDLLCTI